MCTYIHLSTSFALKFYVAVMNSTHMAFVVHSTVRTGCIQKIKAVAVMYEFTEGLDTGITVFIA